LPIGSPPSGASAKSWAVHFSVWIVGRGGWHALFWALTVFAGALLALCVAVLPETHPRERRVALSPRSLFASTAA
jgi:predicted MFS family arabinose efflux permease